jgi:hypothetical protein
VKETRKKTKSMSLQIMISCLNKWTKDMANNSSMEFYHLVLQEAV